MNFRVLYDNNAEKGFLVGWGFSCLVQTSKENILFDTGWNGDILLHNMGMADVNPNEMDKIVISHAHWDHIGGLNHLLKYQEDLEVYVPKSISNNLKNEIKRYATVIEISNAREISENIWTTGELGKKIKEQSLVVKTGKGNIILTGCAHPGLNIIIEKSREWGDVYAVMGGFHNSKIDVLNEIPVVIPCHCTENREKIRQEMPESYKECFAGFSLDYL
jgi:7,8-dihydropterin-6-yl-methyl-4-(beta-D-ribofuranosyl)aminobenzene 5'-phosphate synthase